jgi:hypothetical protein
MTSLASRRRANTESASKATGLYKPVKDSLQIPLSSLLFDKRISNLELDDRDLLSGNANYKVQAHISNDGMVWPGAGSNEIRVMTSFNTT